VSKTIQATHSSAKKKTPSKSKDLEFEPFIWQPLTPQPVVGVDEVGRGCLAGRVYAAACILPEDFALEGVTDSKLISEKRREILAYEIQMRAQVCIGFAEVEEIDRLNILQASLLAMKRAVQGLGVQMGHVLVDGNQRIPQMPSEFVQTTLIKGDLRAQPIAAASIVAKVTRDNYMRELAKEFPAYGFEKHKGYSCLEHRLAIQKHGPCPYHRLTFANVREYVGVTLTSS
jgi:ribonuclease HII